MKRSVIVAHSVFGVALPLAALFSELFTGICADIFCDPIPTPILAATVASVPLANLLLLVAAVRGKWLERSFLRAAAGYAITVSAFYSICFLPIAVPALLLAVLTVWVFGAGIVGILPSAPIAAFISAFCLRRRLAKGPGFLPGAFVAAVAVAAPLVDAGIMLAGAELSQSKDGATAALGLRMCRFSTREDVLRLVCKGHGGGILKDFLSGFNPMRSKGPAECERFYYRVTGKDPKEIWRRRGDRGPSFTNWDFITGGESVGYVLDGLALKGSAYETTVDKVSGIGYGEWTMTFANSFFRDREARMRIALPHGAVVSRVTLWIDGEECEAAFGTKGQVRRAYEAVVSRNRDPLLVNFCGPDRIQAQCFPVPSRGEMKIRLGFTVPLSVAADGMSARMPAPAIVERNFAVPGDILGLPEEESISFDRVLPRHSYYAEDGFAPLGGSAILQTAGRAKGWKPGKIAVVLDTSAAMKDFGEQVFRDLEGLPDCPKEYWVVGDTADATGRPSLGCASAGDFASSCEGGRFSLPVLLKAVKSLGGSGEPAALVWLHAAQPCESGSGDVLAAALDKAENVRFYEVQYNEGPCSVVESLPQSDRIVSLAAECIAAAKSGRKGGILSSLFAEERWSSERVKILSGELLDSALAASKHVGRLWAADLTARTFRPGHPKTIEEAQGIALPWHIVTPVTGAVVLESKRQYEENSLQPVSPKSVPVVPEPSTVLVLAVALCSVIVFAVLRRRRLSRCA